MLRKCSYGVIIHDAWGNSDDPYSSVKAAVRMPCNSARECHNERLASGVVRSLSLTVRVSDC